MKKIRSYEQMVDDGDWPPNNRESILFIIGMVVGALITSAVWKIIIFEMN